MEFKDAPIHLARHVVSPYKRICDVRSSIIGSTGESVCRGTTSLTNNGLKRLRTILSVLNAQGTLYMSVSLEYLDLKTVKAENNPNHETPVWQTHV